MMRDLHTSRAILLASLGLAVLFFASSERAFATFISLNGNNQIVVRTEGDSVLVTGGYELQNQGDETAKDVFVALHLGRWSYAGPPKALGQGETTTWEFDQSLALDELRCEKSITDICAGEELPLHGVFPLRITRYYQDLNGYPFSAVEVKRVVIGDLNETERFKSRVPDLQASIEMAKDRGQTLSGELVVRNRAGMPQKVSVSLFAPREISVLTRPFQLEVEPGETRSAKLSLANDSALNGSAYAFYALIQWKDGESRNMLTPLARVVIAEESSAGRLRYAISIAVVVAAVLIAFTLFRIARRSKRT